MSTHCRPSQQSALPLGHSPPDPEHVGGLQAPSWQVSLPVQAQSAQLEQFSPAAESQVPSLLQTPQTPPVEAIEQVPLATQGASPHRESPHTKQ